MRGAVLLLMTLLAGCAAQAGVLQRQSAMPAGLQALVKAHPLYRTLAQYDRQIAALRATLHAPAFAHKDDAFANAARGAASALGDAAARAKAIPPMEIPGAAQLRADAPPNAPSEARVTRDVQRAYAAQYAQLQATAQRDMQTYRASLLAQQQTALTNYERSEQMRVRQAYDSRRQQLYEKESLLAIDLMKADQGKRLPIETKLRTLALSGFARHALQAQLHVIEARETAAIQTQRRRDLATLAAFLPPLQARANADIARMRGELQRRTAANLAARERVLVAQSAARARLAIAPPVAHDGAPGDMQAQLDSLRHATAADPQAFLAARAVLVRHFQAVRNTDENATRSTWREIGILQTERDRLYADILSQIRRETQRIAQTRGLRGAALTAAVRQDLLRYSR